MYFLGYWSPIAADVYTPASLSIGFFCLLFVRSIKVTRACYQSTYVGYQSTGFVLICTVIFEGFDHRMGGARIMQPCHRSHTSLVCHQVSYGTIIFTNTDRGDWQSFLGVYVFSVLRRIILIRLTYLSD